MRVAAERLARPENEDQPVDPYMTAQDIYGYIGEMRTHKNGRIIASCRNGCHCIGTRTYRDSDEGQIFFGRRETIREVLGDTVRGRDVLVAGNRSFEAEE